MACRNEQAQMDASLEFEKEMDLELDSRMREAESSSGISRVDVEPKPENVGGDFADDSDDEDYLDDWEKTRTEEEKVNDDLFYDPGMDDEDQQWTDNIRRKYSAPKSKDKPLPNSDAVLNCPACFVVLCLDCQRHELYEHQYRAMFVMNCSVDPTQQLKCPKTRDKKGKGKNKSFKTESDNADDLFHPVTCNRCSTQVAVYDKEEVYHFFNVLASH